MVVAELAVRGVLRGLASRWCWPLNFLVDSDAITTVQNKQLASRDEILIDQHVDRFGDSVVEEEDGASFQAACSCQRNWGFTEDNPEIECQFGSTLGVW